jgi:hypothetical protein
MLRLDVDGGEREVVRLTEGHMRSAGIVRGQRRRSPAIAA